MVAVKNATNDVHLLFRPIGFKARNGEKATSDEIEKWKEKNPHIILQQSYLTVGGVIATVVGAVLGIIGFKKDSKLGKWLGGLLTVLGIGSSVMGILKTDGETAIIALGKEIEGKDDEEKVKNAIAIMKDNNKRSSKQELAFLFLLKTGGSEALKAIENSIKDKTKAVETREQFLSYVASNEKQREFAKTLLINIIQEASLETSLIKHSTESLLSCKDLELTAPEKESAKKVLIGISNNNSLTPELREIAISALGRYFKAGGDSKN